MDTLTKVRQIFWPPSLFFPTYIVECVVRSGTTKGLMTLLLEDVVAFYRQHYTTATAWVGLTGDVSDEFVERVKADFAAALPHAGTAPQGCVLTC